jgi:hypothetical protein
VRLYVPLTPRETDALIKLARVERRRPQEQAAYLLGRVLGPNSTFGSWESVQRPPTQDPYAARESAEVDGGHAQPR